MQADAPTGNGASTINVINPSVIESIPEPSTLARIIGALIGNIADNLGDILRNAILAIAST